MWNTPQRKREEDSQTARGSD
jgi:hypothetical protein